MAHTGHTRQLALNTAILIETLTFKHSIVHMDSVVDPEFLS